MKLRVIIAMVVAVLTLIIAVSAAQLTASADVATQAYVLDNLIRLHVVANSDSAVDQEIKYEVRDAILSATSDLFKDLDEISEARAVVEANLDVIETVANNVIAAYGKEYTASAEFGIFPFPLRVYGSIVLPEGDYEALRIVLGTGQGRNWWCVLFPPLCFVNITEDNEAVSDYLSLSNEVAQDIPDDTDSATNQNESVKWTIKSKSSLNFIQLLTTPLSYLFNVIRQ